MVLETMIELSDFYHITLVHLKGIMKHADWSPITHAHDHFELCVHIKGHLQIFAEGKSYLLSGGEIRLYGAGEMHCGVLKTEEEMEWYQINIPAAFLSHPDGALLTRIFRERSFGTGNVILSEKQQEIVMILRSAFALWESGAQTACSYAKAAVIGVLSLLHADENRKAGHVGKRLPALEKILDVIGQDFAELDSVEALSARTHFSVSYINKLFRLHVGVSPYQFLLDKKLTEAKKALKAGVSVTDAARIGGFHDYSGFITLFRKRFGVTPLQYQKL